MCIDQSRRTAQRFTLSSEGTRQSKPVVRLDTSLNLSRRVWDLAALFPAGTSRRMAELLRNEVIVRVNLVPPRHLSKLRGKLLSAGREKGSFSISLGPGRAILQESSGARLR